MDEAQIPRARGEGFWVYWERRGWPVPCWLSLSRSPHMLRSWRVYLLRGFRYKSEECFGNGGLEAVAKSGRDAGMRVHPPLDIFK